MSVHVNTLDKFYKTLDWIFPAYFVLYFIEFFYGMWGLSTVMKLICILMTIFYGARFLQSDNAIRSFHRLFTVYFLYYIFTGLMYVFNDVPISCYVNELYNSIPAMFFVYVGMAERRDEPSFYKKYLIACTISMAVGLFLYVTTPGWYMNRRVEIVNNTVSSTTTYAENTLLETMRFASYLLDNYEVDMYAMIGLSIAMFFYYFRPDKKYTKWFATGIFVNFVAAVMTQQRVAMAGAIGCAGFYLLYGYLKGYKQQSSKVLAVGGILTVLVVVFVFTYFGDRVDQLNELLTDRFSNMDVSDAMRERESQHRSLLNNFTMPIFGHGAGAGGVAAGRFGLPHVSDAAYYELFFETGIVGFVLFLFVIGKTIVRGVKNLRFYLIELMIMAFVLAAMLGSNTLTIGYMTIFPFWYAVGRVWNKHYYYRCKNIKN